MPNARLLHPVKVELEQVDIASTNYDDQAREPIRQAARSATVILNAQVLWTDLAQDIESGGSDLRADGYLLFKVAELNSLSIILKPGDRIKKIGLTVVDLYISRLRPMGHYPGTGSQLIRAYFEEKRPSKYYNPYGS